jgi:hypothetical protein
MCNPRRVEITATRDIAELWQREIRRVVELSGEVTGEARVQQRYEASLGRPVLLLLERALRAGLAGWNADGECFRHEIEGGYVRYCPEHATLEIVAQASVVVSAQGEASETLEGRVEGSISASGTGNYYDDGYGGRTEEVARHEAEQRAHEHLDAAARERVAADADAAEATHDAAVSAQAQARAQAQFERQRDERRRELEARAADRLGLVGVRYFTPRWRSPIETRSWLWRGRAGPPGFTARIRTSYSRSNS